MKTNLAYIDNVMDRAIDAEHKTPTIPSSDRANATKQARKIIGGFRIHDGEAEKKALDDMIANRRKAVQKFRDDREKVRAKLSALGVTPLAVCPTGAWYKICKEAGLFVLAPDKQARVGISRDAFKADYYSERYIDKDTAKDWPLFLKRLFPESRSLASSDLKATLILPDPPADVADTLCKVQSLTLTVAAVGEAIRFAEKPSDLMKNANSNPKDLWAQEQGYENYADWVKRDPIIFTEHETATAIVAQFGDFPIEQQVVDAAVGADGLLSDKPRDAIESADLAMTSWMRPEDLYSDSMFRRMAEQQRMEMVRAMGMQRGYLTSDSSGWTGR